MGRVFDFAKRRIAGYIVFWILVLLFLGIFYRNDPPAQAGALFILVIAFIGSLLYTRRLKRKQRARRETRDAALRMQRAQAVQPPQRTPPPPRQPIEQMPGREQSRRCAERSKLEDDPAMRFVLRDEEYALAFWDHVDCLFERNLVVAFPLLAAGEIEPFHVQQ